MEKERIKFEYDALNNDLQVDMKCGHAMLLNVAIILAVKVVEHAPKELRGPAMCAFIDMILDRIKDVDRYDILRILSLAIDQEGNENED